MTIRFGAVGSGSKLSGSFETVTVTPGATPSVAIGTNGLDKFANWTAGEDETLAISGTQALWQRLTLMIVNDATLGRVITFGTAFVSIGTLTGVISKTSIIEFISDGTNFVESNRTVGV